MAALGRPAYIDLGHAGDLPDDRSVDSMQAHAHAVLDHAWNLGIRYVDAARSYGLAERFLGTWLEDHPNGASAIIVGSKWGYTYTADWQIDVDVHEVKDHSLATFKRQMDETRAELGDHLDVHQVHSATLDTGVLDDPDVLSALRTLADTGVLVGVSVSGPNQAATIEHALAVSANGAGPFKSVQATWNLLEPSVGSALQAAVDEGWQVIVKEAVANGRLTPKADVPPDLDRVARSRGVTVDAVALAAALAQPFRPLVLSGATTRAHLDANVVAVDLAMSDEELARLSTLAEPPDEYWAARGDLAWT